MWGCAVVVQWCLPWELGARAGGLGQHWLLLLLSQNLPFKKETWPPRGRDLPKGILSSGSIGDTGADFWQVLAWLLWGLSCHKQE